MFAETTSMTSVIVDLITREGKTLKNITKGGGFGMTETSMPKVHSGGKRHVCSDGGGGGVDRVELVRAVASVEHHLGTGILNRKAKHVKFNGDGIFTCKRTDGNKVFNDVRRDKYVRKI